MADGHDNRREPRYAARIPATLLRGKREPVQAETDDVSIHGLFLRTAEPPPLRQLVKVEVRIPPEGRRVLLHGMVVYVRKEAPLDGRAGVGVSLIGLDGDVLNAWDGFVRTLPPRSSIESLTRVKAAVDAVASHPTRRRLERRGAELRMILATRHELVELAKRDVRRADVFVATELPLPVGPSLKIVVEHPASGATFALDATVRQRTREGETNGVLLDFTAVDGPRRAALASFAGEDDAEELGDDDIELDSSE